MGRDMHYSQFFNAPLILNPALTGNHDYNVRVGAHYRSQWTSIAKPFVTPSLFFDMPLLADRRLGGDKIGIGLYIMNDQAVGHKINAFNAALTAAYHKSLGYKESHVLSLGVEAGFIQKSVKFDQLIFHGPVR